MLMSDYEELAKVGLGPDQMGTVLAAVSRFRFGLATFDSPV